MKKSISIVTVIMFLIIGLFILTGCGNNDEENTEKQVENSNNPTSSQQQEENTELSGYLGTKTGKFYNQFTNGKMYMEYEMDYEGQKTKVISATNGQKIYSESIVNGQSAGTSIIDGNTMYTIDHNSKMVIKMTNKATANTIATTIIEENDVDMANLKTGTRTIDGKTYDTEEFTVEGTTAIMCFDGNNLAYMVSEYEGEEMIIKVVKTSNTVDDKLFEIPSDYEKLEI